MPELTASTGANMAASARPMAFTVTVTTYDAWGNVATGYLGTVTFSSDDPSATLPSDYAFQPGDQGTQTFVNRVTLATPGLRRVTVRDTNDSSISGFLDVTVS